MAASDTIPPKNEHGIDANARLPSSVPAISFLAIVELLEIRDQPRICPAPPKGSYILLDLLLALGSLSGCQAQDRREADRPAQVGTPAARPTVITLPTIDYAFQTPDTLGPGWTTFLLVNNGGQPHMAQLVRLERGMTLEDFLKAYDEAFRTAGPRPEWARRLGGPGVAAPQDTTNATLYLEPGNYAWICLFNLPDGIPHVVGHGMAAPFVVKSATVPPETAAPPEATMVMRLVDYAFNLSAPLTPGRQMIRVENVGSESHEVGVVKLPAGKTVKDFLAWVENPGETPVESAGSVAGGVTSLAPGANAYFEIDLTPGEYILLCFVTAPGGRSHIEHGMIQQVSVG
jgi:hypothetical protein